MKRQPPVGGVSRRDFLANSVHGVGAAGMVLGTAPLAGAAEPAETSPKIPSIAVSETFTNSMADSPRPGTFEEGMTGAQVFAKGCKDEGLAALFACPGNYRIINKIAAAGIPSYGGRTEGNMCAAADGFIRVTGEVAAASGTEGPGFSNMMMQFAAAYYASTPLLLLAANARLTAEDRMQGAQMQLQQPMTEGIKKWGKRIIQPERIWEYASFAFRQLKSGVPGPVHLDFPGDVQFGKFTDPTQLERFWDKSKYRCEAVACPSSRDIQRVVEMIQKAERPMIVAGAGVFYHRGWTALRRAAEKNDIAVVATGPSKGHFEDEGHRLSAGTAAKAIGSVDLVIIVGQYLMPNIGEWSFSPDAKTIRVHPAAEDLGRNWPLDLGIVSDEGTFLEALADGLPRRTRDAWVKELAAARQADEKENDDLYALGLKYSAQTGVLHPAALARRLADFLQKGAIPKEQTTCVVGGWTGGHWLRRYLRAYRPGQHDNATYYYIPLGVDFGHLVGVGAAVQLGAGVQQAYRGAPVVGFTSDAGAGYSIMEMETLAKYKIPAIMVVYNNNAWGIWDTLGNDPRAMHMYLFQDNIRYDQIAQAVGARGEYVKTPDEFTAALTRSYAIAAKEGVSTLINCQANKEFVMVNKFPPGAPPRGAEPGVNSWSH